jgi:hypothetical protein
MAEKEVQNDDSELQEQAPPAKKPFPAWAMLLIVQVVVFATYAPSLGNGYTMDDRFIAMGQNAGQIHPVIHELHGPSAYFTRHYWADHSEWSALYRPVTVMSFAIRHALFGDAAWPAHLANILLHLIAVWLSYLLLRGLGGPPLAAVIGAAIFGLHAVRSEVVASVVGRAELLSFVFGAGALILLLRSRPWKPWPRISAHLGSSMLLFLAFCSKESSLAWIPFIVIYDLLQRRLLHPGESILPHVGLKRIADAFILITPALCFLFLRSYALGEAPERDATIDAMVNPLATLSFDLRVLNATMIWAYGLLLSILPFELSVDYGASVFPIARSWAEPLVLLFALGLGSLGAVLWLGLRSFRTQPLLAAGAIAFLGFSFITSNLPMSIGTIFGERLYYTPAIGLSFAAAWLVRLMLRESVPWLATWRPAFLVAAGAWASLCMVQIQDRIPVFDEDPQLFAHEVLNQPSSARMRFCHAGMQQARGELEAAAQNLERGLQLCPTYVRAWRTLAQVRMEQDRVEEAFRAIERAIATSDAASKKLRVDLYATLARIHAKLGQRERAISQLRKCEQHEPGYLERHRS